VLTVPGAPPAFHVMAEPTGAVCHLDYGDHGRAVYTFLRDELGAGFIQFIPIIERATEETLPAAGAGWGGRVEGRPLYLQEGSFSFSFRSRSFSASAASRAGRPGFLSGMASWTTAPRARAPLRNGRGVNPFPAQQCVPVLRIRRVLVCLENAHLVFRGEVRRFGRPARGPSGAATVPSFPVRAAITSAIVNVTSG